jgi:hypothetical protein
MTRGTAEIASSGRGRDRKKSGTVNGASTLSEIADGEHQRVTVVALPTFSDGMDSHIAAGLCFQPTCFATAHLSQHAPAPYFSSTALHVYSSFLNRSPIIVLWMRHTSALSVVFICQMNPYA